MQPHTIKELLIDDRHNSTNLGFLELKAINKLPTIALSQVLSYLKVTSLKTALLINFNEKSLSSGIKRISISVIRLLKPYSILPQCPLWQKFLFV